MVWYGIVLYCIVLYCIVHYIMLHHTIPYLSLAIYIYIYIYMYICIQVKSPRQTERVTGQTVQSLWRITLSTSGASTGQPGQEIEGTDSLSHSQPPQKTKKKMYPGEVLAVAPRPYSQARRRRKR